MSAARMPFVVAELEPDPELTAQPTVTDDRHGPARTGGTDPGTDRHCPTDTDTPVPVPASGTGEAAPAAGTSLVPLPAAPRRIGFAARLRLSVCARIALIADYQRRHRTFGHAVAVFMTRPPETWAETSGHLESRRWLQEWMTGRLRCFCEWENVAWGHLVSMPAKAVFQLIEKVFFERQLGFWLGLGFTGLCIAIWLLAS